LAVCLSATRQARAGEPDVAGTVEELKALLERYDRAGGGDTIPIEQALIRLKDARAGKELVPFLAHRRFGFAAAWALSEIGDPVLAPGMLAAFKGREGNGKAEIALFLGAFRIDEVRAALRASLDGPEGAGAAKATFRAALLRAAEPAVEKEVLAGLQDKDPAACAAALLLIGESRRIDLMDRLAALAKDGRALPGEVKSRFGVQKTTRMPGGGMSMTTEFPVLKTVGAVAIEAAGVCVSPTTPGMIAWWYEAEVLPRFPQGPEGAAFLVSFAEAAGKAAKAKATGPGEAVSAAIRFLRSQPGNEESKVWITGVGFSERWEIRARLLAGMGEGAAGDEKVVFVDREGKAAAK
jgi:hypothetical protein